MYHFLTFCVSNFTGFGISEIMLFSQVFLLFRVLLEADSSQNNSTISQLVSYSISTELEWLIFIIHQLDIGGGIDSVDKNQMWLSNALR